MCIRNAYYTTKAVCATQVYVGIPLIFPLRKLEAATGLKLEYCLNMLTKIVVPECDLTKAASKPKYDRYYCVSSSNEKLETYWLAGRLAGWLVYRQTDFFVCLSVQCLSNSILIVLQHIFRALGTLPTRPDSRVLADLSLS